MKKWLLVSGVVAIGFGATFGGKKLYFSVTPWLAHSTYAKTAKKGAWSGGIYSSVYYYPVKVELAFDKFTQKYKDPSVEKYKERGGFVKLHYYLGNNWDLFAGYKGIWRSEIQSIIYSTVSVYRDRNNGKTPTRPNAPGNPGGGQPGNPGGPGGKKNPPPQSIDTTKVKITSLAKYIYNTHLGVLYYNQFFNTGLTLYYTNYKDFKVYQATPKVGGYLVKGDKDFGTIYGELEVDTLRVSDKKYAYRKNYTSVKASVAGYLNKLSTKVYGRTGKIAYLVEDGGVVYSTPAEYKYNYGIEIGYQIIPQIGVKIGASRACFQEIKGADSYSNTIYGTITASF